MFRITMTLAAAVFATAATMLLPSSSLAGGVIDLVDNPPADANTIVLPRLLDAVLINPVESERLNERGRVRLTFVVGTDGTVSDVKITEPSPFFRLNDAAVASVLSRSYVPATRNGTPVAVRIWAIDNFNPDPAAVDSSAPLDAARDLNLSCRYGTHRIAVDACSALMASDRAKAKIVLYPRAHAYEQLGQYDKAIADYDRLIGFRPDQSDLYRNRGFSYEALGQYEQAIKDYDQALKLDPANVVFYFDRGFAWDRLGQHDRAIADFKAAMEHRPKCETVTERGVGTSWKNGPWSEGGSLAPTEQAGFHPGSHGGDGPGAVLGPDKAHEALYTRNITPTDTSGKTTVVTTETCKPSWVMALEEIPDVKQGAPDEVQRLEYRCWARAVWNKYLDAALADCDRALQLNPNFVRAYATRGFVYLRKGDYAAARQDIDAALAKNPRLASALYVRGLARAKTADRAGAETDILTARTVDPEIAETYARYNMTP